MCILLYKVAVTLGCCDIVETKEKISLSDKYNFKLKQKIYNQ